MTRSERTFPFWSLFVGVTLALTGCSSAGDRTSNSARAERAASATTGATTTIPAAIAALAAGGSAGSVAVWTLEHASTVGALEAAFADIQTSAKNENQTQLRSSCLALRAAVSDATKTPAVPDAAGQRHWAAALRHYDAGGASCVEAVKSQDRSQLQGAFAEIQQGSAEIHDLASLMP